MKIYQLNEAQQNESLKTKRQISLFQFNFLELETLLALKLYFVYKIFYIINEVNSTQCYGFRNHTFAHATIP